MTFPTVAFRETIRKLNVGRENQILASKIMPAGRFPVIDQGQAFIAGYSDDEKRLIRNDLPLVVFGDHTRIVKFVDFPFILGADGTKVLKPREDRFDARFFALALQILNLPSRGYNRHFTLLKERALPCPDLPEQRKIAAVLGLVQRAMEQQEQLLALTAELKKALLHQLLTHGLRRESQKQTELGSIPQSWVVVELASAVEQIDYGISAPIPKAPPENGVKIVSTADITREGRLLYDQIRRITAPEKTVKRLTLQTGDVLFNWRNSAELIGKTAVFKEQNEPHVFASFILRIKCGEKKSHNFFLADLMNHWREESVFVKLARRAVNQANYNRNEISVLKIPLPSYEEQREISATVGVVETNLDLHRRKRAALSALFRTLLHELMTARIRVHNLDLPELESAIAA
jgi:type I restriction enzyme, S subunit